MRSSARSTAPPNPRRTCARQDAARRRRDLSPRQPVRAGVGLWAGARDRIDRRRCGRSGRTAFARCSRAQVRMLLPGALDRAMPYPLPVSGGRAAVTKGALAHRRAARRTRAAGLGATPCDVKSVDMGEERAGLVRRGPHAADDRVGRGAACRLGLRSEGQGGARGVHRRSAQRGRRAVSTSQAYQGALSRPGHPAHLVDPSATIS